MSDLIERQKAIDAVVSAMIDGADAELVEGIMEMLPSAQPDTPTHGSITPKTGENGDDRTTGDCIITAKTAEREWSEYHG